MTVPERLTVPVCPLSPADKSGSMSCMFDKTILIHPVVPARMPVPYPVHTSFQIQIPYRVHLLLHIHIPYHIH
jgi:hypothetical protein